MASVVDGAPWAALSGGEEYATWNPCAPAFSEPSAWMETTASALVELPVAARWSTHGPTPVSSSLVSTTSTPRAVSLARTRVVTSQVNACSGYPALVAVPVVLHGLRSPRPAGTSLLISDAWLALPPLCPGSSTTTPWFSLGGPGVLDSGVVVGGTVVVALDGGAALVVGSWATLDGGAAAGVWSPQALTTTAASASAVTVLYAIAARLSPCHSTEPTRLDGDLTRQKTNSRRGAAVFPGGGAPDMQQILQQAQKMQEQLLSAQQALAETEVTGTAGGGLVTATVTGTGELTGLAIDPKIIDPDDAETLADLVVAAVRDANTNAQKLAEEKMGPLAGGLGGGMGGLGLPGM